MPRSQVAPTRLIPLLAAALITTSCIGTRATPFTYQVDTSVHPHAASIQAADGTSVPLAALTDADGIQSDFIENELIITPRSDAELQTFLQTYGGQIVSDSADDPTVDPTTGTAAATPPFAQRRVVVRVTKPLQDLTNFAGEAEGLGLGGAHSISSTAAARLLATAMHEDSHGSLVSPNFVAYGAGYTMTHFTQEQPTGTNQWDSAFNYYAFNGALKGTTNRSTVVGAWQYLAAKGFTPASVRIAIIDGGFWLDPQGHPYDQGPGTDLPPNPLQYNFDNGTPYAGGANLAKCTGGVTCNWHGNGSAGTAAGLMNNKKGMTGTGGQVADPVLLNTNLADSEVMAAVQISYVFGARIINMSNGGDCDDGCRMWRKSFSNYTNIIEGAVTDGYTVVASAGNDNHDVDAHHYYPCTLQGVICVGALGSYNNLKMSYSNYGKSLTIFAPTDVAVMPDGDNPTKLGDHSGTSASAPFVAGVVAMMRSLNPNLTPAQIKQILIDTAYRGPALGSPDALVEQTGYLNALAALIQVGNGFAPDQFEPNDSTAQASPLADGFYDSLSLHKKGDVDDYLITLPDYGVVTLKRENMPEGLGLMNLQVVPADGQLDPIVLVSGWDFFYGDYIYQTATLAPGRYWVEMSGPIQPYTLEYHYTGQILGPDQYEPDDTFATAASITDWGDHFVNLHQDSDVDYYSFTVQDVSDGEHAFHLDVNQADMNVTVQILDGTTQQVLFTKTGGDLGFVFDSSYESRTLVAHVTGTRGRYQFTTGLYKLPSSLPTNISNVPVWVLNPGDPLDVTRLLTGVDDWGTFTVSGPTAGVPAATGLKLTAPNLHVDLYDSTGTLVAGGTQVLDSQNRITGETLTLPSGAAPGQEFYVHLTRTFDDGGQTQIEYQLGFTR